MGWGWWSRCKEALVLCELDYFGTRTWGDAEALGWLPLLSPLTLPPVQAGRPRHGVTCRPRPCAPLPAGIRGCTRDSSSGPGHRRGDGGGGGALPRAPDYFWLRSRGCLLPAARAHSLSLAHTLTHRHARTRTYTCTHFLARSPLSRPVLLCLFSNPHFCLKIFSLRTACVQALPRAG